jgi:hypothetical protein
MENVAITNSIGKISSSSCTRLRLVNISIKNAVNTGYTLDLRTDPNLSYQETPSLIVRGLLLENIVGTGILSSYPLRLSDSIFRNVTSNADAGFITDAQYPNSVDLTNITMDGCKGRMITNVYSVMNITKFTLTNHVHTSSRFSPVLLGGSVVCTDCIVTKNVLVNALSSVGVITISGNVTIRGDSLIADNYATCLTNKTIDGPTGLTVRGGTGVLAGNTRLVNNSACGSESALYNLGGVLVGAFSKLVISDYAYIGNNTATGRMPSPNLILEARSTLELLKPTAGMDFGNVYVMSDSVSAIKANSTLMSVMNPFSTLKTVNITAATDVYDLNVPTLDVKFYDGFDRNFFVPTNPISLNITSSLPVNGNLTFKATLNRFLITGLNLTEAHLGETITFNVSAANFMLDGLPVAKAGSLTLMM